MMVVDSSAVVAILLDEADSDHFTAVLARSAGSCISALNAHETAIVVRRRKGIAAVDMVWDYLATHRIEIVPFDETSARNAAAAYELYGKGINPKARLNLADCAAYVLAKTLDAPLLFKGDDFAATDVKIAR